MTFTAWKHEERNRHRDRKKNVSTEFFDFVKQSAVTAYQVQTQWPKRVSINNNKQRGM